MTKRGHFDRISIFFHWMTVALFVPLLASVFLVGLRGLDTSALLTVHRSAGTTVLLLSLLRFAWRKTGAKLPPFPERRGRIYRFAVTASENVLYALLFAQPLLGLSMMIERGRPFSLFVWQVPELMSPSRSLAHAFGDIHEKVGYALLALIFAHAATALIHHFILRDDVLTAMLPWRSRANASRRDGETPEEPDGSS